MQSEKRAEDFGDDIGDIDIPEVSMADKVYYMDLARENNRIN